MQEIIQTNIEYILRLLAAALCGGLVGIEREKRQKNAGIRTHVIVSMAAALMMIISKYAYFDVLALGDTIKLDPSRVASGVVSAIGFLGVGIIFVRQNSAIGVTTAAGLWATVAIGLAMGAGMYFVGFSATILMIFIHFLLHSRLLPYTKTVDIYVKVSLMKQKMSEGEFREFLRKKGVTYRSYKLERSGKDVIFSATLSVNTKKCDFQALIGKDILYDELRVF